jgi:hypothetical protein
MKIGGSRVTELGLQKIVRALGDDAGGKQKNALKLIEQLTTQ